MELSLAIWNHNRERLYEYRRRSPESTELYRLIYNYREEFEYCYEELFQERYGFLKSHVLESFDSYLNCGILRHGCARAVCENCDHSELIAFSCKRRLLCPSCGAKRGHIFAETLDETILLSYPHRHFVFTIPKRLRLYFKYDRRLFKRLYQAAWKAWQYYVEGVYAEGALAAVMSLHTAGDLLNFHPHLHALILPGVIANSGEYLEIREVDIELLTEYFSHEVLNIFLENELLSREQLDSIKSWKNSGFGVWIGESILSKEQRLFVSRYLVKCPISLDRIKILDNQVHYYNKDKSDYKQFSPLEFLAELSQHLPGNYEQVIRYYGYYSARSRGARKDKDKFKSLANNNFQPLAESDKKPASRSWARLIKKVYEVNPLQCPKCQGTMKIKAFILNSNQISRICKNLGLSDWRAPPKMGKDQKYQQGDSLI